MIKSPTMCGFVLVLCVCLLSCSSGSQPVTPPWEKAPGMTVARSELASTLFLGKIFVAGGINFWGSSDSFEVFDIENGQWKVLPSLPESLNHIGLAVSGGKVYVSGGFFNMRQTEFSDALYMFDIQKNSWTKLGSMPDSRAAHFMIERKGLLYLLGGRKFSEIWSYDIENDSWDRSALSPLPMKRDHISVVQDDNYLYVVGGRIGGAVQKDCWRYDFQSKKWEVFAQLPEPRGGQTAALFHNKIHVIGGEDLNNGVTFSRHDVFNIEKGVWTSAEELPTPRHGITSQVHKNKWYILGGGESAGVRTVISASDKTEVYALRE